MVNVTVVLHQVNRNGEVIEFLRTEDGIVSLTYLDGDKQTDFEMQAEEWDSLVRFLKIRGE